MGPVIRSFRQGCRARGPIIFATSARYFELLLRMGHLSAQDTSTIGDDPVRHRVEEYWSVPREWSLSASRQSCEVSVCQLDIWKSTSYALYRRKI